MSFVIYYVDNDIYFKGGKSIVVPWSQSHKHHRGSHMIFKCVIKYNYVSCLS